MQAVFRVLCLYNCLIIYNKKKHTFHKIERCAFQLVENGELMLSIPPEQPFCISCLNIEQAKRMEAMFQYFYFACFYLCSF